MFVKTKKHPEAVRSAKKLWAELKMTDKAQRMMEHVEWGAKCTRSSMNKFIRRAVFLIRAYGLMVRRWLSWAKVPGSTPGARIFLFSLLSLWMFSQSICIAHLPIWEIEEHVINEWDLLIKMVYDDADIYIRNWLFVDTRVPVQKHWSALRSREKHKNAQRYPEMHGEYLKRHSK